MTSSDELIRMSAVEAVENLRLGEIRPIEMIDAAIERIEAVDGTINALPIRCYERARDHAKRLEDSPPDEEVLEDHRWLAGLPVAIKDLTDVEGVRSTFGSPVFKDRVAETSAPLVTRTEARGGIVLAKSNTPEFGSLPVTWNPVFGATRNPWNTGLTVGGSSGGAAAALAAGEIWLAHGSDIGGSLRIPAAFTGTVGLRPSFGRVPRAHGPRAFNPMSVEGPMARNVADLALFLDVLSGYWPDDPLTLHDRTESFQAAASRPGLPRRIAFSSDLGFATVEKEVDDIVRHAVGRIAETGAHVEEATPDFSEVGRTFATLMQVSLTLTQQELVETHGEAVGEALRKAVQRGLDLPAARIYEAEHARARLFANVAAFFHKHDLLVTPAVNVAPFDVGKLGLDSIDGAALRHTYDWISLAYAIVPTSCPALVLPCGLTSDGRPVGLQLIARPRAEATLLAAAAALEPIFDLSDRLPLDPKTPK